MADDKYNLGRFVDAQEDVYTDVINELKNAQKTFKNICGIAKKRVFLQFEKMFLFGTFFS